MEKFEQLCCCGCFHYDASSKKNRFKCCETCDYAEKIPNVGWICGYVKWFGGSYEKKKKEDEASLY